MNLEADTNLAIYARENGARKLVQAFMALIDAFIPLIPVSIRPGWPKGGRALEALVCYPGQPGQHMLVLRFTRFDP